MEDRLHRSIEFQNSLRSSGCLMSEINTDEFQCLDSKLRSIDQTAFKRSQFSLLSFICREYLRRKRFLTNSLNAFAHPEQVFYPKHRGRRQEIQKTDFTFVGRSQFRNYTHRIFLFLRKLSLYLKGSDTVNLISEEIDTIRIFRSKRINIKNTSTHGKLPRFVHVIHMLKTIFRQSGKNFFRLHVLTYLQFHCPVGQFIA